jgi:hypothetical protein
MIQENKTGFLFEPGDHKDLASVLKSVSRKQLQSMSRSCHEAARNNSMDNHLDNLMAVYRGGQ